MSSTLLPPDRRSTTRLRVVTEGSRTGSARAGRPTRGDRAGPGAARAASRAPAGRRQPGGRPPRRRPLANSQRRLRMGVVVMVLLLLALAGRLTQLQGFSASTYAKAAALQRTQVINLPAVRGEITDRGGATLAQDVDARAVYADPTLVDDPTATAKKLSPLVSLSVADIVKKITVNRRSEFVYIARGLAPAVGTKVDSLELRGVGVLDERRRIYPNGTLAANVVGYTKFGAKDLLEGNGGVELAYDSVLRGQDGTERLETDPAGREIPSAHTSEKAPIEGKDVRLTLDEDIQWEAQTQLDAAVRASDADSGTIVALDPKTGNILAMADSPAFDPNNVGAADPASLRNMATGDAYEPGSVNKIITMAAAVDQGLINPETPVTVPSDIVRGGATIRDSEAHGTLPLTATGVLAHSSNIGAVLISEKVGSAGLESTMRAFGLGKPTGLDFPGESGGVLAPSSRWSASQAATIAYGQGMSATALQMASVYATVANGGVKMTPRLVDATGAPGAAMVETPIVPGVRVVKASTAATLAEMLEQVTTASGTAPAAAVPGYRVAGKTGTAYRVDPKTGRYSGYVASFIGFAPADNPKVVIAVVLDNPKKGSYFGGVAAAPVFQKVMTFALATLGAAPSTTKSPRLALTQPGTDGGVGQTDQLDQPAATSSPTTSTATNHAATSPTTGSGPTGAAGASPPARATSPPASPG